jgi:hypothetical protein
MRRRKSERRCWMRRRRKGRLCWSRRWMSPAECQKGPGVSSHGGLGNGAWVVAVRDDAGGWMDGSVHRNPTHSAETIEKTRPCSEIKVAHFVSMASELGLIMRDDQRGQDGESQSDEAHGKGV